MGFFLAFTAELTGDRDLGRWAASCHDHRVRQVQDLFELPPSAGARELAEKRTPTVARQWRYRTHLGLDSFEVRVCAAASRARMIGTGGRDGMWSGVTSG